MNANVKKVLTASWALRFLDAPTHGFANKSLLTKLEKETPNFWKWAKNVTEQEAVTYIWRPEEVAAHLKKKFGIN